MILSHQSQTIICITNIIQLLIIDDDGNNNNNNKDENV